MARGIRIAAFTVCVAPLAWLLYAAAAGQLGPDPVKALMLFTGEWALRMLALALLASPLQKWTSWSFPIQLRRMLGLFAFFYACVHFFSFLQFYINWSIVDLSTELAERPYITVGFAAWLMMLPLAATSTRSMQRRLRGNWRRLHRLVYAAAVLACLHLLWQARSDVGAALAYLLVFAGLLGWRVWRHLRGQRKAAVVQA